jgi:hypothetical protein
MLPTWLFLFALFAVLWGLREGRMLLVFLVAAIFGASSVIDVVLLGRAPITPALFVVPFLVLTALRQLGPRPILSGLSLREPGGWLLIFTVWAVFTAVAMPRLFEGELLVYTSSRSATSTNGVDLVPLKPNSTNITQSVYLVAGLIVFLAARALMSHAKAATWVLRGLYASIALMVVIAAVDLTSRLTATELGLSFLRNANYAIVRQSAGAWPRLQGTLSEPSSLAGYCVPALMTLLVLWLRGVDRRWTGPLAAAIFLVAAGTLSSSAFAGLSAVAALLLVLLVWRTVATPGRLRLGVTAVMLLVAVATACILVLWSPPWLLRFLEIAYAMIFEKADSDSGIERLAWAMGTWENFLDTYGLGVGAGSARGSSLPFVILGNTGFVGAAAFLTFIGLALFGGRLQEDPRAASLTIALRFSVAVGLFVASLAGTMIDPGVSFFFTLGVITGLSRQPQPDAETAERSAALTTAGPLARSTQAAGL